MPVAYRDWRYIAPHTTATRPQCYTLHVCGLTCATACALPAPAACASALALAAAVALAA